jgi:hypothetical protein
MNRPHVWGVLDLVERERERQEDLKAAGKFKYSCADAELSDAECLAVLVEEVGEAGHEVNECIQKPRDLAALQRLQAELIQSAAVAVAWCERLQIEIDELAEQPAESDGTPDAMPAFKAAWERDPAGADDDLPDPGTPSSQQPWTPDPMAV